jgi:hypothetical protein
MVISTQLIPWLEAAERVQFFLQKFWASRDFSETVNVADEIALVLVRFDHMPLSS